MEIFFRCLQVLTFFFIWSWWIEREQAALNGELAAADGAAFNAVHCTTQAIDDCQCSNANESDGDAQYCPSESFEYWTIGPGMILKITFLYAFEVSMLYFRVNLRNSLDLTDLTSVSRVLSNLS